MNFEEIFSLEKQLLFNDDNKFDELMDFIRRDQVPYDTLMAYYQCAIMEIETKFKVLNQEFSVRYDRNPIESIKGRVKSRDSLIRKIRKRNIPLDLETIEKNITDIAGVRVICSFPEDIYMLADCLLLQDDIKLIEKKDYIANPKPNGYRSLHLIVEVPIFLKEGVRPMIVEVQLRTIAMDFWASLEHKIHYKKKLPGEEISSIISDLKMCADTAAELDKQMEAIKLRIEKLQDT